MGIRRTLAAVPWRRPCSVQGTYTGRDQYVNVVHGQWLLGPAMLAQCMQRNSMALRMSHGTEHVRLVSGL